MKLLGIATTYLLWKIQVEWFYRTSHISTKFTDRLRVACHNFQKHSYSEIEVKKIEIENN